MKFEKTDIYSAIDPYFQNLLQRRKQGLIKPFTASTGTGEIAVVARVDNPDSWENISEVRTGSVIKSSQNSEYIVTGRIPVQRIEAVRAAEGIYSLKPARKLRRMLDETVVDTRSRADLLPENSSAQQGAGVVVGIVDFGCDFVHQNFRHADGSTRLLGIWDQNGVSNASSPFGYGRFYDRNEINLALQSADPYSALGYEPAVDIPFQSPGTHGTHVMDIAAGNGRGSNMPGVAPAADILFVDPAASDIPWGGPQVVGSSFGDSVQLLEAVRFIFDFADTSPVVVNLSLGTNGGPHDGSSLVEQGLDAMLTEAPNRAVVIAASNSFADGIHVQGSVATGGTTDVQWVVSSSDSTDNEIEFWYSGDDVFLAEIIAPDGSSLGSVSLGSNGRLTDDQDNTLLFVSHRGSDPNNNDNTLGIFLESNLPHGTWTVRLHGETIANGHFHGWIERDDRGQSTFSPPHDNSYTLGSISTGNHSIAVGSFDAHKKSKPLSWFSSAGPTRDNRQKPEISAPGHDVRAAHSRTDNGVVIKSGTSMAAPAVTGVIALALAQAQEMGIDLSIGHIRNLIQQTAQSDPPTGSDWDDRYGYGRIDAHAIIVSIINGTMT